MDEFSYLSVLLSIIIGLAVTQLLTGMRGQMLGRARVRGFWPTQVWAGSLLLVSGQTWWAMFDLRNRHEWDFSAFAILLAQTIALYLLTGWCTRISRQSVRSTCGSTTLHNVAISFRSPFWRCR